MVRFKEIPAYRWSLVEYSYFPLLKICNVNFAENNLTSVVHTLYSYKIINVGRKQIHLVLVLYNHMNKYFVNI